jgi:DNA polymerase-3 subunit gamma/tau
LNCERGPAADPCNECVTCAEITRGSDLDVIEVDAATYSKVEQVRDLTESLKYGPARDRYKVVVLDEIHRLSRQAFDALLKIVEEPPPHLVFIFATTEIDAVPATILSRCQEFHFRRVPSAELAAHLRNISVQEGIQASATALRLIARAGEGSVRDSVALLDQLATFGSGAIADEDAVRLLGGLDTALFQKLIEGILAGDPQTVGAAVRRVEEEGWDPRHVYGQFLAFCRDALHLAMGGSPAQVDLPAEEAQALAAAARASGYENLLRLLNQLLTSEPIVRRSETGALAVEIAWLRAAELPKLTRVEELLVAGNVRLQAVPGATRSAPAAAPRSGPAPVPPARASAPPPAAKSSATPPRSAPASPSRKADPMTVFREEAAKRNRNLGGFLDAAAEVRFEDGGVRIVLASGDTYSRTRSDSYRPALEELAVVAWGPGTGLDIVEDRRAPGDPQPAVLKPVPMQEVEQIPAVQAVLEIFKGSRIETVEDHASYPEE